MRRFARGFLPARDEQRAWVWRFTAVLFLFTLAVGGVLAILRWRMPETVVQATSDALVFQSDTIIDLVQAARPRFGMTADLQVFGGIRQNPPVPLHPLLAGLGATRNVQTTDSVLLIQRFQVTRGCVVSIERVVDRMIRLQIQSVGEPCMFSAALLHGSGADVSSASRLELDDSVPPGRTANLELRPPGPLTLRRFAVTSVGYTTMESGSPESAVREAVVRLPRDGIMGENAFLGDAVTLGTVAGDLIEVRIDETIRSTFKGKASRPAIAGRSLRPSVLRHIVNRQDFTVIVASVVTILTVFMAVFQVLVKS